MLLNNTLITPPFGTIWHDAVFQDRSRPINPIIDRIAAGSGWRGPVAIYIGFGEWSVQPKRSRDFLASDIKFLAKFLKEYKL